MYTCLYFQCNLYMSNSIFSILHAHLFFCPSKHLLENSTCTLWIITWNSKYVLDIKDGIENEAYFVISSILVLSILLYFSNWLGHILTKLLDNHILLITVFFSLSFPLLFTSQPYSTVPPKLKISLAFLPREKSCSA